MNETLDASAEEAYLIRELLALAVDEVLALAYTFRHKTQRLRLYLDSLRRRSGERAQFASLLICFDLAEQGDAAAQKEFSLLSESVRSIAKDVPLVESLLSGHNYLTSLWSRCQEHLAAADTRASTEDFTENTKELELDLLNEADLEGLDFEVDMAQDVMRERFDLALGAFLGAEENLPVYDPEAGFRFHSTRDIERTEKFIKELDSLRDFVPMARGFRALLLLYYGTHLRSKTLFGGLNQRKQNLLRLGLNEFVESGDLMSHIAGVISPMHADVDSWIKVVDILVDFVRWAAANPSDITNPERYNPVGRLIERGGRSLLD